MPYLFATILGIEQWMIILVIVLVLFGGKKIPELLRGVGKGVGELQKGLEEGKRQIHASMHEDPTERAKEETVRKEDASAPTK